MRSNAEYQQLAEARKAAAKAAALLKAQQRLNRRTALQVDAERRKAELQLLRARRNYQPGWSNSYSPAAARR